MPQLVAMLRKAASRSEAQPLAIRPGSPPFGWTTAWQAPVLQLIQRSPSRDPESLIGPCHVGPAPCLLSDQLCLQNLFLALASIAALALPMLMGRIPLWMAVMGHEGSTLLVALNCLRLLRAPTSSPAGALWNPLGSLKDGQSLGSPAAA